MGSDEQISDFGVGIQQKSVGGSIVEYDLVDLGEPHLAVHALPVIDLAIGPMSGPRRKAIGGDF